MEITKTFFAPNRNSWRKWLEKNHQKEKEIWLIYYKKSSAEKSITYNEAVEEALCFGWIDGIEKSINHQQYTQRFTPRRAKSNWSDSNKERMKKLISLGKVTEAGLAAYQNSKLESSK